MAKSIREFGGTDTFGRDVQVAQRIDGVWFCRVREFNGFGIPWGRWELYREPTFETHGVNVYTDERFEYDKPVLMWGLNKLHEYDELTFRLPKIINPE